MTEKKEKGLRDLYLLKRKIQRENRDLRKKILGIDEDHTDTSMQRVYGEATKTRRALKIELFGSKSKSSATQGEETSIEAFVREILEENSIEFVEQKAIRYINVDFFISSLDLVIQVHGSYWHCDPRLYPKPKNMTQKKNIEKDRQSVEIIEKAGHSLLNIWGYDIKNNKDIVRKNILRILSSTPKNFEESSEWTEKSV